MVSWVGGWKLVGWVEGRWVGGWKVCDMGGGRAINRELTLTVYKRICSSSFLSKELVGTVFSAFPSASVLGNSYDTKYRKHIHSTGNFN